MVFQIVQVEKVRKINTKFFFMLQSCVLSLLIIIFLWILDKH